MFKPRFFATNLWEVLLHNTDIDWGFITSQNITIRVRDQENNFVEDSILQNAWIAETQIEANVFIMVAKISTNLWHKALTITDSDLKLLQSNQYKKFIDLKDWDDPFEKYLSEANIFPLDELRFPSSRMCSIFFMSNNTQGYFHFTHPHKTSETYNNMWPAVDKAIQYISQQTST